MEPPPAFSHLLVCTSHRCGSNLLNQHLKGCGLLGRPREYYSPGLSTVHAIKEGAPLPEHDFLGYHEWVQQKARTPNGVRGVKLMWPHLAHLRRRLARQQPQWADAAHDDWALLTYLFPRPAVVWIRRTDRIRQAISMQRAKQTSVFSSPQLVRGQRQEARPPVYDFSAIHETVEKFTREDESWGRLFSAHGVEPIMVSFEQIATTPRDVAESIVRGLGLTVPETWEPMPVPVEKRSDALTDEWAARYAQDLGHRRLPSWQRAWHHVLRFLPGTRESDVRSYLPGGVSLMDMANMTTLLPL
jgi:trehalose 2-sulfotransferase